MKSLTVNRIDPNADLADKIDDQINCVFIGRFLLKYI